MSATADLNRRYRFSASHRLHVDRLGDERNRSLFGKCNNPHGHGHNYVLQVTLRGPVNEQTGMIADLGALDVFVKQKVLERFHLANLNHDPAFALGVPSTENLAEVLWQIVEPFTADGAASRLHRIRVEETSNNAFDFYGPHLAR